ncbi:MAG: phage holin family protein [Vicinamibacterales bacterium]
MVSSSRRFADLLHDLRVHGLGLVRGHAHLAVAELADWTTALRSDVMRVVAGAVGVFVGLLASAATAVLALVAAGLEAWMAAAAVALALVVAGVATLWSGLSGLRRLGPPLPLTANSLRDSLRTLDEGVP